MGQIGYEAFCAAFMPGNTGGIPWEQNREDVHIAWEAAAAAVLAQPHQGTVVGGPIEMRDYDYIVLAQPHQLIMPDDTSDPIVPAGTRLVMLRSEPGSLGLTYESGAACKVGDWPYDSPGTKARVDELVTAAKTD